ncbi:MAG: MauE/DoxX family redox-associated membrane protein [Planktomarina sp.]
MPKTAVLHRMVSAKSQCPHGLKSKALLQRKGYIVEDNHLSDRPTIDAFKEKHGVTTTPQTFIDGVRIGGYDDLRRHFGMKVRDPNAITYQPVMALFAISALIAVGITWLVLGTFFTGQTIAWFIATAMILLGMQKLQDIDKFATMFLNYDLLAKRWVRYGYIYPFIETGAGFLMLTGLLTWIAAPVALVAAGIGAVSVFKAVYIDKRTLKCACVGDARVPLGFVSLTENLMMVGMALWMLFMM